MITTRSAYLEIYPVSLLQTKNAIFCSITDEPTPHRLMPEPDTVFTDFNDTYRELLLPLAVIDLSALDASLEGKIPVIYYEDSALDFICFRLNDDWKIETLLFADYEGNLFEADDEDIEPFEEGYEEVTEQLESFRNKYLKIEEGNIPMPESIDYSNARAFYDQAYDMVIAAMNQDDVETDDEEEEDYSYDKGREYFGPVISLTQFSPNYPVLNGNPEAFRFVGAIHTTPFRSIASYSYYVFFDPETRTVAQMVQHT